MKTDETPDYLGYYSLIAAIIVRMDFFDSFISLDLFSGFLFGGNLENHNQLSISNRFHALFSTVRELGKRILSEYSLIIYYFDNSHREDVIEQILKYYK